MLRETITALRERLKSCPLVELSPDHAAAIFKLTVTDREEGTLVTVLRTLGALYEMPDFERTVQAARKGRYYHGGYDDEKRLGVPAGERRIADVFTALALAFHKWCDEEEEKRPGIAAREAEEHKKEKERLKVQKKKRDAKRIADGKRVWDEPDDEDDEDIDELDEHEREEEERDKVVAKIPDTQKVKHELKKSLTSSAPPIAQPAEGIQVAGGAAAASSAAVPAVSEPDMPAAPLDRDDSAREEILTRLAQEEASSFSY